MKKLIGDLGMIRVKILDMVIDIDTAMDDPGADVDKLTNARDKLADAYDALLDASDLLGG